MIAFLFVNHLWMDSRPREQLMPIRSGHLDLHRGPSSPLAVLVVIQLILVEEAERTYEDVHLSFLVVFHLKNLVENVT